MTGTATGAVDQALRYARTLAGLRPAQVVHRARLRAQRAVLAMVPPALVVRAGVGAGAGSAAAGWPTSFRAVDEVAADAHLPDGRRFRFLEESRDLGDPPDWDQAGAALLWRYHLHYFDWAWAFAAHPDRDWARRDFAALWRSWHASTVAGRGVAWSPYVASLRAWAWCGVHGALVAGTDLEPAWTPSLRWHAAFLRRHLELDVGGNHLIKNLKALAGLGVFLDDHRLVARATQRLAGQLAVQVLADGGHYERSPGYHAQVLADLIDVHGLLDAAGRPPVPGLGEAIEAMRRWLGAMLLPDGDVPLFNDCTLVGQSRLAALGPTASRPCQDGLSVLQPSGYAVATQGRFHLVADLGPPCPPDLPAHAHADCLSFELAVDGRRIIVDAGTSTYAAGPRRSWERSTAAHNTLEIDGADQTEVWGAFRAARRAQPRMEGPLAASHDGYERLSGQPRHRRTWRFAGGDDLVITDDVAGSGTHAIAARLHVAPGIAVDLDAHGAVTAGPLRIAVTGDGVTLAVSVEPGELATGFGRLATGHAVVARTTATLPVTVRTTLSTSR